MLKARADSFERWLRDYKTAADSNRAKFTGYNAVAKGATGLRVHWAKDLAEERNRAAGVLYNAYKDLSDALVSARTRYIADTTRTVDLASTKKLDDRAVLLTAASLSGCVAHYDAEIGRLKGIFASAEATVLASGTFGIGDEELPVKNNRDLDIIDGPNVATWKTENEAEVKENGKSVRGVTITGTTSHTTPLPTTTSKEEKCTTKDGETTCEDIEVTTTTCSGFSFRTDGIARGSYTRQIRTKDDDGILRWSDRTRTVNGVKESDIYRDRSTVNATYSVDDKKYKSTDPADNQICPNEPSVTGTTQAAGEAAVRGTKGTLTPWPEIDKPAESTAIYTDADTPVFMLEPSLLLGRYHPGHDDRDDLDHASQFARAEAARRLGELTHTRSLPARTPSSYAAAAVPEVQNIPAATAAVLRGSVETAASEYRKLYTEAYDRAYRRAVNDMGGAGSQQQAVWRNFHWEYDADSLLWGGYTQNGTANTTLDDGTVIEGQPGCALMNVAKDGKVTVLATRLDYETGSYGTGNTFTVRTAEQRVCKVKRTRTPRLTLRYEPPTTTAARPWRPCPSTLTASTLPCGTDSDSAFRGDYYNTDFLPAAPGAEKFKLYSRKEAAEPSEALVAHVAAKGIDAVNKAVFRNASGFAGGSKKHCYRHPSSAQLGSPPRPAFAFFDDTAHSAMASVNVVWQQPTPKIVSKLGSADDLKMMANTVALVASPAVAYVDATRTSSFYGAY